MKNTYEKKSLLNEFFLSPTFLLRISGLPSSVMDNLRFEETIKLINEKNLFLKELVPIQEKLLEEFYILVKTEEEDTRRKKIIKLKQDVSKNKFPRDLAFFAELTSSLEANNRKLFNDWFNKMERLLFLNQQLPLIVEEEAIRKRTFMQDLVKKEDFQKGVLLSSEGLYEKLTSYINTPINDQKAKMRKIEKSLYTYISRVATKTSPFSTFTPIAFGEFTNKSTSSSFITINDQLRKNFVIRINHLPILYLVQAIENHKDLNRKISLQVNRTVSIENGYVHFLKTTNSSENIISKSVNQKEDLVNFKTNKTIETILYTIDNAESITKQDIVNTILNSNNSHNEEQLYAFIDKLISLGVIECRLNIVDNTKHIIDDLIKVLSTIEHQMSLKLLEELKEIRESVLIYERSNPELRLKLLRNIQNNYKKSCEILNVSHKEYTPLIFEDTSYSDGLIKTGLDDWKDIKESLEELLPLYTSYSTTDEIDKFRDWFVKEFGEEGECDEVIPLLERYQRYNTANNEGGSSDNRNKNKFHHYIYEQISNKNNEKCIEISESWLKDYNSKSIKSSKVISNSFFLQPYQEDGKLKSVVNRVGSGYGQFMSRFDDLYPEDENEQFASVVRELHNKLLPENEIFAEINGVFGFNANIHTPITRYEISYPGIKSSRESKYRIYLEDIIIVHSKSENKLYLKNKHTQEIIHPLYLGFLNWFLLPSLYKLLFLFTPYSYSNIPIAFEYYNGLSQLDKSRIVHIPQVSYKSVTISREQWWIPLKEIPAKSKNMSDLDYLQKYEKWTFEKGLPTRVFMSLKNDYYHARSLNKNTDQLNIAYIKPQYVDFQNPLSIKNFEKYCELAHEFIVLENVHPQFSNQSVKGDEGSYTSEVIVEVNKKRNRV
ncbi:lantibiotic dehydratase [Pseudalkalibacillus sp. JSM 102089]|uniref:lantibiotic dehydratase n=1 Tax=Pseudalkalibacillus sp. JSM 102089 TaxID=3229856 RepID=UPI0035256BD2